MFSRKPRASPKRALGPGRCSGTALPRVGELRQEQVSCRTETFTPIKRQLKSLSLKNARQTPATPKRVSQCMEQLRQAYSTFHINSTGRGKPGLGGLGGPGPCSAPFGRPPALGMSSIWLEGGLLVLPGAGGEFGCDPTSPSAGSGGGSDGHGATSCPSLTPPERRIASGYGK